MNSAHPTTDAETEARDIAAKLGVYIDHDTGAIAPCLKTFGVAGGPNARLTAFVGLLYNVGYDKTLLVSPVDAPDAMDRCHHPSLCDATGTIVRGEPLYVLNHLGTMRRVRRSALPKLLGETDAEDLVQWADAYRRMLGLLGEVDGSRYTVANVIGTACDVIMVKQEFVSRGTAHKESRTATAEWVEALLRIPPDEETEDKALAELDDAIQDWNKDGCINAHSRDEILSWLASIPGQAEVDPTVSDYLVSLATVASLGWVREGFVGLLCSAPDAYRKHLELQTAKLRKPSVTGEHFGFIGTRQEADVYVRSIESKGENEWGGEKFLVNLRAVPSGAALTWWTGDNCKLDVGKQYHVRLTPTTHGEWDGERVTTVSRVAEFEPPPPKEKKATKGKK